ncbi:1,4-alpha-glucan branching protein GlgB [Dyella sp. 2HG41-7]|uniref:1,4-alpha-glucan branching protein GlgB n=1 Tax=Dyella sp. 2HG41-7 TaxID=2883239 RepID=UPI001F2723F9
MVRALSLGTCGEPFDWLGAHPFGDGWYVAAVAHGAEGVDVILEPEGDARPARALADGVFAAEFSHRPNEYRLRIRRPAGDTVIYDPYSFDALLPETTLQAFHGGQLHHPGDLFGAHLTHLDGVEGVHFSVWAPNARRVSVVGDFNQWDGRRHVMRRHVREGVWEIFIPGLKAGAVYKYELLDSNAHLLPLKADPFARRTELPPATASMVAAQLKINWHDASWIAHRESVDHQRIPISIYEVHVSSWQWDEHGRPLNWDALATRLIPYVQAHGFTHIELMPISEYPFGGSWGYQPIAMYAPTARMGRPEAFARFVDSCHVAGIGVIIDWVSAHFPSDEHGLRDFDGTKLYEHSDPREGVHQDWDTLIYNYGRHEVQQYLLGSAAYWVRHFHIDGLRVDAVASMLYRDYSRTHDQWIPNKHGGRENLEAIAFLQALNDMIAREQPGVLVMAEESTAWPGVTGGVADGGLGFSYKWNMGWMHDSLNYMSRDPLYRRYHHNDLTFSMVYAYTEKFILPLSHDEVVHGKGSLISRMPGDRWRKFANLRAYFGFMWTHPGKKLLFMGGEFAQQREWHHDRPLDWHLLKDPMHDGVQKLVGDLNSLLVHEPALHRCDHDPEGFEWVVGDDAHSSVYAYLRHGGEGVPPILVVCNFTPRVRHHYRIGVPEQGIWHEICNTDSAHYGGSNLGNHGQLHTDNIECRGHPHSLNLLVPPLATLVFRAERSEA